QARSIPPALQGSDVLASAQTGTGKTAAFGLPVLQRLLTPARGRGLGPRALVLTPTRELAAQVEKVIRQFSSVTKLRMGVIVGGVSMSPQERLLRAPLDLLIATPGRLIDHMQQRRVDFSRLELFVLDEADRMLDMGFIKPVKHIAAALPKERQTLLFSATLEGSVSEIAQQLLRNPVRIQLASAKVRHEAIDQRLHMAVSPEHKHALLSHLLEDDAVKQAIVFTGTKRGADRLAKRLAAMGHPCAALHGNLRQNARQRAVDALRSGNLKLLVATDVAARGIDVLGITHVINFDLPTVAEDYIHRIGRTGRNGATGIAISLVAPQDTDKLRAIERLTGYKLARQESPVAVPPRAERQPQPSAQRSGRPAGKPNGQFRGQAQGQGQGQGQGNGNPTRNAAPQGQRRPNGQNRRRRHGSPAPASAPGNSVANPMRNAAPQGTRRPAAVAGSNGWERRRA
ncbi:MAG TPA: DEAD/DEAH box helicase, partial [bacterium]